MTEPPALSPNTALFLDFDGTLAPIQDDPDTVTMVAGLAPLLPRLAERLDGALAVISGRGAADLSQRVQTSLWRIGAHGLQVCPPGEAAPEPVGAPAQLVNALERLVELTPGTRLERKGEVLALHYRQVPQAGTALAEMVAEIASGHDGYSVQHGKMVIEAKPERANKGRALEAAMQHAPFAGRVPLMIGDDATDEDAIRAALKLGGQAIKVGDGASAAPWRLQDPPAVARWLRDAMEGE